jgi:UTP--glucose-1-phosphate uridylyltransferase
MLSTDHDIDTLFAPFADKMRAAGLHTSFINTFRHYYAELVGGATGLIPEDSITPVESLPDLARLPSYAKQGRAALSKAVTLKLNGGLGTSMGLQQAKSLLPVKHGHSFLDIIANQVLTLRARYDVPLPLVLMNSFNTRDDSLAALERYPALRGRVPLDFMQHQEPKILQGSYAPAEWPADPELEWCPPGHGDLYAALVSSGMIDVLLDAGYEYVFVSNADNLGAVLDIEILGYIAEHDVPFLMEVADRTEADKKGGHLARRADGQLILRESAQCPKDDEPAFQDIARHRYFNTNNVWLRLSALKAQLDASNGVLLLPMIRNSKTLDPKDSSSPKVYQLETAMGAAIGVFAGAQALRVPRTRFAPVKLCSDLLALWSDAYVLTDDWRIEISPERSLGPLTVDLDARYYKLIADLQARVPDGAPSLVDCARLRVTGDVRFERDVVISGDAVIVNEQSEQRVIPAGSELRF